MLFFYQFKKGNYGRFYGAIDPLVIMTALQSFRRERFDALTDYENEEKDLRDSKRGKGISYAEYLQNKAKKL